MLRVKPRVDLGSREGMLRMPGTRKKKKEGGGKER